MCCTFIHQLSSTVSPSGAEFPQWKHQRVLVCPGVPSYVMAKHLCLLDATVFIIANGAPNKNVMAEPWRWERAQLLLRKERVRAEWKSLLRQKRPGHTWKARAAGEGLGSSWTEDHCPLGRVSPCPSYSYNPCFPSLSAACKSRFVDAKEMKLRWFWHFVPLALTTFFLAYAWRECCAQPLVLTAKKGIHKLCASSWWGQNWLYQLAAMYVLPANYTKI